MSGSTTPSPFFDALTDPGVEALLGASQGFAQAAMPTRMPTPFGAVLGMGAGGALAGEQAGQKMQLANQQIQHSKMQNQIDASGLPLALARNASLANMWAHPEQMQAMMNGGSAPLGAPPAGGGGVGAPAAPSMGGAPSAPASPSGAPVSGSSSTDWGKANAAALASLPDDATRNQAINAALRSGLPQEAWAPWIASVHNESGWNLKAPDGSAGEIGPGQVMPDTGKGLGYTSDQLRNPSTNLLASAQYFGKQWQGGGARPAAAFAGYNTGAPAGSAPDYVGKGMNQLAGWGYPGATATGSGGTLAPGDALATAQQYEQRANDLDREQTIAKFMQSQGMPAFAHAGDPVALRSAAQQYRAMALAGPTAGAQEAAKAGVALQTEGPIAAAKANATLPADLAKLGFQAGPNGQMVPIPGGPADPAYVGQKAAADAFAQAAASRTHLITTRSGVYDPVSGKEVYRQPEYHELQDPNSGVEYPGFVQPGENGQLTITGGPPGMANGALPPTKLGPGQEDVIKHLADQFANEDKQKYEGATNSLFQLNQQDKNIAALNAGGGWSSTGSGANAKLEWAKIANSALQTLGVKPVMDPDKVSSWEDATKIQTQLAFAQAKQLGSREAQQVVSMSRAATPGAENTPEGYRAISAGYHEMNNREIDLRNYNTAWLQTHGGNLIGAETTFNNQFSPQMYAQRAISSIKPEVVSDPAQLGRYLPGTYVTDGKTISPTTGKPMIVQVPPRPGTPPVPDYLQQSGGQSAP